MTPCQEHIAKLVIREYVKGYLMEGKKPSGGLRKWFKEKWVDISRKTKSGGHPPCGASAGTKARKGGKRAYPKCVPRSEEHTSELQSDVCSSDLGTHFG